MATLRQIAGSWVIDWYTDEGRRKRKVIGRLSTVSRAKAEKALKIFAEQRTLAAKLLNSDTTARFSDFADSYLQWHAGEYPSSHERIEGLVEKHLLPAFGHLPMGTITAKLVEDWKRARFAPDTKGHVAKAHTVTKELHTLKAILNKAVQWEQLDKSSIVHVAPPKILDSKPPRYFTANELARLYAACRSQVNGGKGPQPNSQHAFWWKLYVNTGLRRTEGLMLRWDWIGQTSMKLLSSEEERTKSGRWREVPISPGAREALDGFIRDGDYVLPRVTLPTLSRAFYRDAARAGLTGGSLHTLRHTFCSHLVMAGVPLRTVQVLAGHSTVRVTERYAHLAPQHLHDAASALAL